MGFVSNIDGFIAPSESDRDKEIVIDSSSERLQLLTKFTEWDGKDFVDPHQNNDHFFIEKVDFSLDKCRFGARRSVLYYVLRRKNVIF